MCGRYTLRTRLNRLAELYLFDPPGEENLSRYNIAPTQQVAAVRAQDDSERRELVFLRWGLVPSWADDLKIGNRLINARADTVADKPSFRSAFKKRRCLVLADGFYEWTKNGKAKQPYYITMKDGRPFAFAGLWERWNKGERPVESCTIITTDANDVVSAIHDRMPVILYDEGVNLWLDGDIESKDFLNSLLVPYSDDEMKAYPVSTIVNSSKNEVTKCVELFEHFNTRDK